MKVFNGIRDGLKDQAHRLISVVVDYLPQPGRAVFILMPYIELPVLGTEAIPVSVAISIDTATGCVIVEVDGYGIRDLGGSVLSVANIVINILMPIVGWLVSAVLHDIVGDTMHIFSTTVANAASGKVDGAPDGTTIEETPGLFRYRVSVPLATPSFAQARFNELITTADGMALAGSWSVLNFTEGEVSVNVSEFGWQPPKIRCGAAGEAVYQDIAVEPKKYATLYSQVEMASGGSAPVNLCTVTVLNAPDLQTGIQFAWSATRLPTMIEIDAPAALADFGLTNPITLEVRTTAGVFRAAIPPPAPLTPADVALLRGAIHVQLERCDSIILPPWFLGSGAFDLDWIVDPLIDPDRLSTTLDLIRLEVNGLLPGSLLELGTPDSSLLASAPAGEDGAVRLSVVRSPGAPPPRASISLPDAVARGPEAQLLQARVDRGEWPANAGVAVMRQRLEGQGAVLAPLTAIDVVAAQLISPR
jgi:hypothetical protein